MAHVHDSHAPGDSLKPWEEEFEAAVKELLGRVPAPRLDRERVSAQITKSKGRPRTFDIELPHDDDPDASLSLSRSVYEIFVSNAYGEFIFDGDQMDDALEFVEGILRGEIEFEITRRGRQWRRTTAFGVFPHGPRAPIQAMGSMVPPNPFRSETVEVKRPSFT
jgi:hypothetical protein